MARYFFTTGILVLLVLAGLAAPGEAPPRFAIYRVDLVESESTPPLERRLDDPRLLNLFVTQEYLLATAVKTGAPVLTESDIEDYCWATQRVQLTAEGAGRWDSLGGFQVPFTGLPILIEVDGKPRYGAMVWNPASSYSSELPQFWCKTLENQLTFGGRYISAAGDTIHRENYDPMVRKVMGELGKLADNCEGN
jgi:hypothetical protein